jgi:hypothetical protein
LYYFSSLFALAVADSDLGLHVKLIENRRACVDALTTVMTQKAFCKWLHKAREKMSMKSIFDVFKECDARLKMLVVRCFLFLFVVVVVVFLLFIG